MSSEMLPSASLNYHKNYLSIVLIAWFVVACSPTIEKDISESDDEKVLSKGMAILADAGATDKSEAILAFEMACKMGNNYGCHKVGISYNNGLYGKNKNYAEAKRWYEKSANKGYVPSQLNIANLYAYRLLPLDDHTGFEWLIKAGEGLRTCQPGSIEADSTTSATDRQRLCALAKNNFKELLSIFRKRMTGEEMSIIEKTELKNLAR